MWFSRQREFRADLGGAKLSSKKNMIQALEKLKTFYSPSKLPKQMTAFGVSGDKKIGLMEIFFKPSAIREKNRVSQVYSIWNSLIEIFRYINPIMFIFYVAHKFSSYGH